jgi:ubiquinone/menaquinone biosynthesis C-methylase UbiE
MSDDYGNLERFEGFAQYYDRFMLRLVNYPSWVDYIIRIFNEHRLRPHIILDLACGTGIPSLLFAKKGYRIIGIDGSAPMLEIFKEKIAGSGFDVQVVNADISNFTIPEKADAAVSLYDSINYLLTEQKLLSCFECVAKSLNPGGIFAFDMNTIYCLESFWGNRDTPRRIAGINSIWHNTYDPQTKTSTLKLTVFTDDGKTFQEIHKERGYSGVEIKDMLETAGFVDMKIYSHLTLLPTNDKTLRMMIVARKIK